MKGKRATAPNGGDEAGCERVLREPQQQAGLAHAGVTDQQEFDEEVIVLAPRGHRTRMVRGMKVIQERLSSVYETPTELQHELWCSERDHFRNATWASKASG